MTTQNNSTTTAVNNKEKDIEVPVLNTLQTETNVRYEDVIEVGFKEREAYLFTLIENDIVVAKGCHAGNGWVNITHASDEVLERLDDAYRNRLTCSKCAADKDLCECNEELVETIYSGTQLASIVSEAEGIKDYNSIRFWTSDGREVLSDNIKMVIYKEEQKEAASEANDSTLKESIWTKITVDSVDYSFELYCGAEDELQHAYSHFVVDDGENQFDLPIPILKKIEFFEDDYQLLDKKSQVPKDGILCYLWNEDISDIVLDYVVFIDDDNMEQEHLYNTSSTYWSNAVIVSQTDGPISMIVEKLIKGYKKFELECKKEEDLQSVHNLSTIFNAHNMSIELIIHEETMEFEIVIYHLDEPISKRVNQSLDEAIMFAVGAIDQCLFKGETNQLYTIYEADIWLTHGSKSKLGMFTNKTVALLNLIIEEGAILEDHNGGYKDILNERYFSIDNDVINSMN